MGWFNYDWFAGPPFEAQKLAARRRCAEKKFPNVASDQPNPPPEYQTFFDALEVRTLLYLRDGFSYEMKRLVDVGLRSDLLTFECEPVDEQYKVGAFVVSVPFEEINRVEVFAVHPSEKPEDVPLITGFRSSPTDVPLSRDEIREMRDPGRSPSATEDPSC
jgi:hypothetical protein